MTKISFGHQFDDSKSAYNIRSRSDSATEISVGDQHGRSERIVSVADEARTAGDQRAKVLFVAANPLNTGRLALDEEFRSLAAVMLPSPHTAGMSLIPLLAARAEDFAAAIHNHRPDIVHFSGHGSDDGYLVFAADDGRQMVSVSAIADVLETAPKRVTLVFLNACFLAAHVTHLRSVVPCVIAMQQAVPDDIARQFSRGFYGSLNDGASVAQSFRHAESLLRIHELSSNAPSLHCATDVDPASVVLGGFARPATP